MKMKKAPALQVLCLFTSLLLATPDGSLPQAATAKNPRNSPPAKASAQVRKSARPPSSSKTGPKGRTPAATPAKPTVKAPPRGTGVSHVVKKGQNLFGISRAYHVSIESLVKANHLAKPSALKVGQRLVIPGARHARNVEPFKPLSPKQRGEIARSLEDEDDEDDEEGEEASQADSPDSGEESGRAHAAVPPSGEVPDEAVDAAPKESLQAEPPADQKGFIWPLINRITSRFGPRGRRIHKGIDIAAPSYHEVVAAADGEVIYAARSRKGLGNSVALKHDDDYTTVYGHGVVILVKEGDTVRRGEPILGVGNTGRSTGNHLHFEIRKGGVPVDPLPLMPPTLDELVDGLRAEKS